MCKLGILIPVTSEPGECCFTFALEQDETYQHAISRATSGPPLSELLAAFLSYANEYGRGFRIYRTAWFPVGTELDPFFQSLVKAGYAQRLGLEYRWTEKIAPIMEAAYLWPLEDDPRSI